MQNNKLLPHGCLQDLGYLQYIYSAFDDIICSTQQIILSMDVHPPVSDEPAAYPVSQQQVIFSAAERAIINPFRPEYLDTTSPAQRKHVAITKILPALFTYWDQNDPDDPRIKNVRQSSEVSC